VQQIFKTVSCKDPSYRRAASDWPAVRAMHIHPTVSEFIPVMMGDLKALQ
jgi:hypothetical protein